MYPHKYIIPNNTNTMYRNSQTYPQDERFFLTPFLLGGLAGGALGYGIANNNQNNQCCGGNYPIPIYPYPVPYNQYNYTTIPYTGQSTFPSSGTNFLNNNFY